MNKLFFLIFFSFISFSSYSQVYKKICVQFGEVSCVEYATTGLLQINDLKPWFFDDDSAYRVPLRGTKIENEIQEIENPFREKIESDFSIYGEGIATAMASIAQRFNELEVQNDTVEDNLTSIRGRVDQVVNKDAEISSKYQRSIPELHKKISDLNKELDSSLNDEKHSLEEESEKVEEELENNPVSEEGVLDNAPIQRMEFEAKDKLLQEKREKLFKEHDPGLSKNTVQNIYETSGRLQTESRSFYASDDYESAFFGQELAMGLVDFGLGLTPVVGDGIALYEAFIGESPLTGQKLSGGERILSATTGVIGLVSFGTLGALTRGLSKGGRLFSFSEKVGRTFGKTKALFETATDLGIKTKRGIQDYVGLHYRVLGESLEEVSAKLFKNKVIHYSPVRTGPLSVPNEAGTVVANTFRSGTYFSHYVDEPLKLYRVYDNRSAQVLGRYYSRVKPNGPAQAMFDSALDPTWNTAQKWVEITVPKGERLFEGIVSEVAIKRGSGNVKVGQILGNGSQVYIAKDQIPSSWITGFGDF